jgi:hypothetical protein
MSILGDVAAASCNVWVLREGDMLPSSARVALITGCGKPIGIGNSTARALSAAGATVVVSDVVPTGVANEHNLEGDMDPSWGGVDGLVEEIVRNGGKASSTLGDVSAEADAARMSKRSWIGTAASTFSSTMRERRRARIATRSRMYRSRPGTARWRSTREARF